MSISSFHTTGNVNIFISEIKEMINSLGSSISFEEESIVQQDRGVAVLLIVERYSMIGSNRLSLSVMIVSEGEKIELRAATSGGSQAVFFKLNTFGESNLLYEFDDKLKNLEKTW